MRATKILSMAFSSIWQNKMRSFLTMLGIIIGISSVIILVGIGKGTQQDVNDQIEKLGTNLITVNITGNTNITDNEIKTLKTKPGIKEIAPVATGSVNIKHGSKSGTTTMEASNSSYEEIKNASVSEGRFITDRDVKNRYNVLVIGTETAENIFGYSRNVVGQNMYVNGIEFTVVGLLKSEGTSSNGTNDDKIVVPLSTGSRMLNTSSASTFYVEAEDKNQVETAMSYLELFLNKKFKIHDSSTDSAADTTRKYYRVMSQSSILETAVSTASSMTTMLAGIAGISLIVGGIGIMNIMLVSVVERTREIGIRKAIGAKRRTILLQFLIEAATISCIGGIIGVITGYFGSYLGKKLFNTTIVISQSTVLAAVSFSIVIGIVFGLYPAGKASKLNPIEALRFE